MKKLIKDIKYSCIVDTKEEAREMEQEYISTIGSLNGRMEINTIINSERCKNYRQKNLEERRNAEAAYRQE